MMTDTGSSSSSDVDDYESLIDYDQIGDPPFYLGQAFRCKDDIKTVVKNHAVFDRRQLVIDRNDKVTFRVVCKGMNPQVGRCDWVLHIENNKSQGAWIVKSLNMEHKCLQMNDVRLWYGQWKKNKRTCNKKKRDIGTQDDGSQVCS